MFLVLLIHFIYCDNIIYTRESYQLLRCSIFLNVIYSTRSKTSLGFVIFLYSQLFSNIMVNTSFRECKKYATSKAYIFFLFFTKPDYRSILLFSYKTNRKYQHKSPYTAILSLNETHNGTRGRALWSRGINC